MNSSTLSVGGALGEGDPSTPWAVQQHMSWGAHDVTPLGAGSSFSANATVHTPASVAATQMVESTPEVAATPNYMPPAILRGVAAPRRGRATAPIGSTESKVMRCLCSFVLPLPDLTVLQAFGLSLGLCQPTVDVRRANICGPLYLFVTFHACTPIQCGAESCVCEHACFRMS